VNKVNSRASGTFRISFQNEMDFAITLTPQVFMEAVRIEIPEMDFKDYDANIERREGEYLIDITAKAIISNPVTLKVTPVKETILTDQSTGQPVLIFLPDPAFKSITLKQAPNAQVLRSMDSVGESSSGLVDTISNSVTILSGLSLIASSPIMSPLIRFLKTFKLISRLKLINIFFGAYLEFVLNLAGRMFELGNDHQSLSMKRFNMLTRGKLTKFKITPISVDAIWTKYALYFFIVSLRLYQALLRKYQKKRKNFSSEDQIADRIADESRIIIFTMVVIDISFYSFHCLSHMSLDIHQTRDSVLSYILSVISIIMVTADVLLLFQMNTEMTMEKLLYDREAQAQVALKNIARKKRIDARDSNSKEVGGPIPRKMTFVMENLETDEFDQKKPREVSSYSAVKFFAEDIKIEKMDIGRYFNTISMVKLLIVEPFYVTLQMFPGIQILCLVTLQSVYFIYFCRLAFKHKVFLSWLNVSQVFLSEVSMLVFLLVGAIFQVGGGIGSLNLSLSNGLQIVGIAMLSLSTIIGTVVLIFSSLRTLLSLTIRFKNYLLKMKYKKTFTDQPTVTGISRLAIVAPDTTKSNFKIRRPNAPSGLSESRWQQVEPSPNLVSRPFKEFTKKADLGSLWKKKNQRIHVKSKRKSSKNEEEPIKEKQPLKKKSEEEHIKEKQLIVKRKKTLKEAEMIESLTKELKLKGKKLKEKNRVQLEI
jgi:hypothetical protein